MKRLLLLKNSLALRLLKVVFSIYLIITVIVTLLQMFNEYLIEEHYVKNSLNISQSIFQQSLTQSAKDFDLEQLSAIADGILKQPTLVGIEIVGQGIFIQKGQILNKQAMPVLLQNGVENSLPSYLRLFGYSFDLAQQNRIFAKVTLYTSNQRVINKVKYSFLVTTINAVIKTIALWLLFIWAFNKFLTQQLDVFCREMENTDIDKQKYHFLHLETFNSYELSRIEYFFNDLLKRIVESRNSLAELNKTLEQKVAARTEELSEKKRTLEKLNSELEQKLNLIEILVITDELTQLYNRRYFNNIFPKELQRAARENMAISFLIFDIDHFKQYNDCYGHQKGDDVLKKIGAVLKKQCLRGSDIPLRLGGEEFGVIFSGLPVEEAFLFADKIRQAIADTQIEHVFNSAANCVTASFGLVTTLAHPHLNMDELYKQADDALYQAKDSGRNKVVQAPTEPR